MNIGPKTKELIDVLDRIIEMLDADGQENWSQWMLKARTWIKNSDFCGIEKLLAAYGGMGSFNDTGLRTITRENENFSELQSKAWRLATEIKREYETHT